MKDEHYTCDVCGKSHENVVAGRWLFYCSDNQVCKDKEHNKVYDNEIAPDMESGDFSYTNEQGLSDYLV